MRYLTLIIIKKIFIAFSSYGNIWLFELKYAYLFVFYLKIIYIRVILHR